MLRRLLPALMLLVLLCGCSTQVGAPTGGGAAGHVTYTDALGRTVELPKAPKTVASLMGSFAETWLLAGGTLAGVTEDVVSERGLAVGEDTQIIGSVKHPSLEALLKLEPDFVLLSADLSAHVQLEETLTASAIPHAYFHVEHFDEYLTMLDLLTDLTGRKDLYEQNGLQAQKQIEEVLAASRGDAAPTVLLLRAMSTKVKAKADDSMICKMLDDLGAVNIAAATPSLLEELSLETILMKDPDYILVETMGESEKAQKAIADSLESNPAFAGLTAVQNGRYVTLPKALFHYKPNARWGESYAYLADLLYPAA